MFERDFASVQTGFSDEAAAVYLRGSNGSF